MKKQSTSVANELSCIEEAKNVKVTAHFSRESERLFHSGKTPTIILKARNLVTFVNVVFFYLMFSHCFAFASFALFRFFLFFLSSFQNLDLKKSSVQTAFAY